MTPSLIPFRKDSPTPSDVHVDVPLTQISIAYLQQEANFVARRVFPMVPVQHQSDKYWEFPRGAFFRDEMKIRAPGARAEKADYTLTTASYAADVWALSKYIDDQVRANADPGVDQDRAAANLLTQKALLNQEVQWASKYFAGSLWTGGDVNGVAASPSTNEFLQWSDPDSDPIGDIRTGKRTVLSKTGFLPNKLVLGVEVYDALVEHPDIVARVDRGQTPGEPAQANAQTLARLFEVDEVLVMRGVQNTAAEGATDAFSFIGGKKALLAYATPSPGLMEPSAGYHFAWTGYLGAGGMGQRMSRMRDDLAHSDVLEIEMAYVPKLVAADLGYFFDTAVA